MIHTEWYTQNAHTLYQTAVVWHAQSSGVRVKQLWPHFDEHLHMFMLTMTLSWKDMHGTWLYLLPIYYYVIGTIWGQVKQVSIKFNFLYHNFRWALICFFCTHFMLDQLMAFMNLGLNKNIWIPKENNKLLPHTKVGVTHAFVTFDIGTCCLQFVLGQPLTNG